MTLINKIHMGYLKTNVLLKLGKEINEDEGENDVGSDTDAVGGETSVEGKGALLGEGLLGAVKGRLVRHGAISISGHLLHTSLNEVEGKGASRGEETGNEGTTHDRDLGTLGETEGLDPLLGLLVRGKHTHVKGHSTDNGRGGTAEEANGTLILDNTEKGITDTLVVAALLHGKGGISLHTDEGKIGRVTNEGTDGTGSKTGTSLLPKRKVLARVGLLQLLVDDVEDTHTSGGVGGLTKETSRETLVKGAEALALDNVGGNREGATLDAELDADLDQVNGLDDAGGEHTRETTIDEGLGGLPGRVDLVIGRHSCCN